MVEQTIFDDKISSFEKRFWLQWVLTGGVAWVVGMAAGAAMSQSADGAAVMVVGWTVIGSVIGVQQWFVLRQRLQYAGWWPVVSAVGVAVGWFVGVIVKWVAGVSASIAGVVTGAMIGIMQWFVLRRCVYRAGWWVLASAVSTSVGWVVIESVIKVVGWPVDRLMVARTTVVGVGAVSGAITGFVLIWLLRHPVSETSSLGDGAA